MPEHGSRPRGAGDLPLAPLELTGAQRGAVDRLALTHHPCTLKVSVSPIKGQAWIAVLPHGCERPARRVYVVNEDGRERRIT